MKIEQWLARRISPETKFGEGLRRIYRHMSSRVDRAWTEVFHALAASQEEVRFVQVGSNDSGYGDPLRFHILNNGWRGLLIEPLPYVYERLQARCGDINGLILENVAIDTEEGYRPFYHLRPSDEPDLPPWYDMLGSFLKENVLRHQIYLSDIPDRLMSTPVRCITFDHLCVKHGFDQFDVLHIDAEGYDYEILRKVNLTRYQPTLVLFESKHLSDDDYAASLRQLHEAGMLTHTDSMDTIAVAKTALQGHASMAKAWKFLRSRTGMPVMSTHAGTR